MKQMLFAFMCMFIILCVAQLSSYTIGGTTYTNAYDNDVNVNATSYTMGGITHIHGTVDGAPISTSSYSLGGGLTHTSCSAGGTSYSLGRSSYSKNYHYRDRVATSTTDIFGNTSTIFSDGTTASSLTDIFGNTATIFSDGTTVNSSTDIFGNTMTW